MVITVGVIVENFKKTDSDTQIKGQKFGMIKNLFLEALHFRG